jgi:hypothetical protein
MGIHYLFFIGPGELKRCCSLKDIGKLYSTTHKKYIKIGYKIKFYIPFIFNVLYQVTVFYADRKSKMAAIAGHRLTLDPMGKCSNAFF